MQEWTKLVSLKYAKISEEGMVTKSSIILDLGESDDVLKEAIVDLRAIDVDNLIFWHLDSIYMLVNILYFILSRFESSWQMEFVIQISTWEGGDLGWGKLFRFKCGIKNYFQLAKTN